MKASVRKKYFELRKELTELQKQIFNANLEFEEYVKIQELENKVYKKCRFYKGFIEASEKIKEV